MPRQHRIQFPGAFYHLLNRGNSKQNIFHRNEDFSLFLKILDTVAKRFQIEIHAYCLMTNHYHLAVSTPKGNLSDAMKYLGQLYAQKIHRAHETDGHLFKGRYKAILVDRDEYFLHLVRYIHLNPVKAGIVNSPADYPWSSHRQYWLGERSAKFLNEEFGLAMFSSAQPRKSFHEFVLRGNQTGYESKVEAKCVPNILGSDAFVRRIESQFFETKKRCGTLGA